VSGDTIQRVPQRPQVDVVVLGGAVHHILLYVTSWLDTPIGLSDLAQTASGLK
jgi:hypothetical protein